MKPRLLLDTNVLVSHFVVPHGNPSKILNLIESGGASLIVSSFILDELFETLRRKLNFSNAKAREAQKAISEMAEVVLPIHSVSLITSDPSDNRILECALSERADVLVTGDKKHLLPLKKFKGIPVVSPADFLKKYLP